MKIDLLELNRWERYRNAFVKNTKAYIHWGGRQPNAKLIKNLQTMAKKKAAKKKTTKKKTKKSRR